MSRASLLRTDDVRFLMELVGELHELPDEDRAGRRKHLAQRVCDHLDGYLVLLVEASHYRPLKIGKITRLTESGYRDECERTFFDDYITKHCPNDPIVVRSFEIAEPNLSVRREDIVPDHVWHRSTLYNEYYRLAKVEQLLHTRAAVGYGELGIGLGIHRTGRTPFSNRELQLADVLNQQLPSLYSLLRSMPGASDNQLPTRYKRVIERLKHGDSVKQVAQSLGLSPHTVQGYVKEIYRHYGVTSRSQLLVKLLANGNHSAEN